MRLNIALRLTLALGGFATCALMGPAVLAQTSDGAKYVSMGSSYAAGPGVGQIDAASATCWRSLSNYARRLAERRHLSLVDVACSGATTRDILDRPQYGFPPQIDAVDARTRLVTITIGGNDVSYMSNLFGYSCRDTGGSCAVVSDAEVDQRFTALPDSLRAVIAEVHRRAPQASVVLIDYLSVVPAEGPADCGAVPLSPEDAARMRAAVARLAHVIGAVAAETHTLIVQASMIGANHDACSSEPYVAGYKPALTPGWPHPVGYHLNQTGMDVIADALDKILLAEAARR